MLCRYITHATILTSLYLAFFSNLPRWFFVSLFLFWRSCYDVGLGILLRYQSEYVNQQERDVCGHWLVHHSRVEF